jgi:hypothetical protein
MIFTPFTDRFGRTTQISGSTTAMSVYRSSRRNLPASYNPHASGYVSGSSSGSNISSTDQFRQGVSINNAFIAQKRSLPRLYSGREDNVIEFHHFGEENDFNNNTPFVDMPNLDTLTVSGNTASGGPISFINGLGTSISYPVVGDNPSYKDLDIMDGVIEPLVIRDAAAFKSLDPKLEPHDVRGCLMDGSQDSFGKTTVISRLIPHNSGSGIRAFFDGPEHFGFILTASIRLDDPMLEDSKVIAPFNDNGYLNRGNDTPITQGNSGIIGKVAAMSPDTEIFPPPNTKVATSGFVFDNPAGTDSIAFGGKRYYA